MYCTCTYIHTYMHIHAQWCGSRWYQVASCNHPHNEEAGTDYLTHSTAHPYRHFICVWLSRFSILSIPFDSRKRHLSPV